MGVLDEAIREHLELKRRRGADPGAVAREESEALGSRGAEGSLADRHDKARGDEAHPERLGAPGATHESRLYQPGDLTDPAQETAELDMRAVFDGAEQAHEPAHNPVEPDDPVEPDNPVEPDRLWLEHDSQPSGLLA